MLPHLRYLSIHDSGKKSYNPFFFNSKAFFTYVIKWLFGALHHANSLTNNLTHKKSPKAINNWL